jgi:hypothetical protein
MGDIFKTVLNYSVYCDVVWIHQIRGRGQYRVIILRDLLESVNSWAAEQL